MKKRMYIATMLLTAVLCACQTPSNDTTKDLMKELPVTESADSATAQTSLSEIDHPLPTNEAITDFTLRLFQESYEKDSNTLLSPISVLSALSMTANGAKGETLSQMESAFGVPVEELNSYLHTYLSRLSKDENNKLHIANSVWFKDVNSFTVEQDFLEANQTYYDAGLFKAAFDENTLKDINKWVEENTDGMIENILNEIPKEAMMYLVNALAFDAEWQNTYDSYDVSNRIFTKEDGSTQNAEFMYATEYSYLETEHATGFLKHYKGQKYAFAALLPKEGMSLAEFVAGLSGNELHQVLQNPIDIQVKTALPKFQTEYSVEMSEVLKTLGMTNAFDWQLADFSGIGTSTEGNLVINRVLHKTFIEVGEQGTKAGAATIVEVTAESCAAEPEEVKEVILDRPFVYLIIDCENSLPLFIGTMTEINE